MEELQRNIDEVFRESLSDYREAPPPAAWSQVMHRLDEEDRSRRRTFMRWPWIMLSLLFVVGCAWMVVGLSLRGQVPEPELQAQTAKGMAMPAASAEEAAHTAFTPTAELPDDEDSEDILRANRRTNAESKDRRKATLSSTKDKQASSHKKGAAFATVADAAQTSGETIKASSETAAIGKPAAIPTHTTTETATNADPNVFTATVGIANRRKDVLHILPHIRIMKPLPAKRTAPQTHGIKLHDRSDFPELSVAKPAKVPSLPFAKNNASVAAAQQSITWRKPAVQRITKLAVTKRKAKLLRNKVTAPGELSSAPTPVVAAVMPSPNEEPKQQKRQKPELALASKATGIQQAEPAIAQASANVGKIRVTYPDPPPVYAAAIKSELQLKANASITSASAAAIGSADSAHVSTPASDAIQEPRKPWVKPSFSLAVFSGIEQKTQSGNSPQFSIAARLMWQVSNKVSVGIQPTFRYTQLPDQTIGEDAAYQRSAWRIDSFRTVDISPTTPGKNDEIYNYVVHQIYDSIVIRSRSIGGAFWEIELPVMVRCRLNKSWSVWGGPSLVFGGKLTYSGDGAPQVYFTERKDSVSQSIQKPKEEFLNYFGTSSLPEYSTYQPSDVPDQASLLRLGYAAGIGYNRNCWLLEASLHGQLSGYGSLAQPARDIYAHPNVRISLGYLLFSNKKSSSNGRIEAAPRP